MEVQEKQKIAQALREIQKIKGTDCFIDETNQSKTIACLKDFIPDLEKKYIQLFKNAGESNAFQIISKANKKNIQQVLSSIAQTMEDTYGVDQRLALDVLDAIASFYGKSDGKTEYCKDNDTVSIVSEESTYREQPSVKPTLDVSSPGKLQQVEEPTPSPIIDRAPTVTPTYSAVYHDDDARPMMGLVVYFVINALIILGCDFLAYFGPGRDETTKLGFTFFAILCMAVSVIVQSIMLFVKSSDADCLDISGGVAAGLAIWLASLVELVVVAYFLRSCPFYYYVAVDVAIILFAMSGTRFFGKVFDSDGSVPSGIAALFAAAVLIYILVNNYAIVNWPGSGFFAWFVDIITAVWVIIVSAFQMVMLVIGAGFWWHGLYCDLFLQGPVLNMLLYAFLAVCIIGGTLDN